MRSGRVLVAVAALMLLAGCSSSRTSRTATTTTRPGQPRTLAAAGSPLAAACEAFDRFAADLARLSSRGDQVVLTRDAESVAEPLAASREALTRAERKLMADAVTLAAHVGSASWHEQGTPVDPEILAVQDDCA